MALAPFVWGEGGAQMTPEQIAAQRKVAEAMMERGMDYSPIQSPWQGGARVAQGLFGALQGREANAAMQRNAEADRALITSLISGGGSAPTAAPAGPSVNPSAPPQVQIVPKDQVNSIDAMADLKPETQGILPRAQGSVAGIESGGRYDLPGPVTRTGDRAYGKYQVMGENIPVWTKEVLGRSMTPQEFLANPDAQDAVFNAKFGQYAEKYGTTGASKAWFAGEGGMNNPGASDQLGTTVAGYANRFDKGMDDAALPPNAKPTHAVTAAKAAGPMAGVNPALLTAIASPYTSDSTKKIATILLQNQLTSDAVTTVDLGNAVGIMDKRGNIVRQIPKGEPNKGPEFREIEMADGTKAQVWVNPRDQSVTPYNPPRPAAPAAASTFTIPPAPPGVNAKIWRDEQTRIAADAAGGKLTEAQTNATQFANRMEDAEKSLAAVESDITAGGWGVLKDRVARGVTEGQYNPVPRGATNFMVSDKFQRFEQGKSQFITALLRKESGAAISQSEFDRYDKEFFPQMGDGKAVIEQKQAARKVAIEAMKKGAGPSYAPPASVKSVPAGIDPKVWGAMTPEERALWK